MNTQAPYIPYLSAHVQIMNALKVQNPRVIQTEMVRMRKTPHIHVCALNN